MSGTILTVTTPPSVRALCTLAAVKGELSITDGSQDVVLTDRILAASASIDSYCVRTLALRGMREIFRPTRALHALLLAGKPVAAISSLVADGATLVEGADFEISAENGMIYRLSSDVRCVWTARKVTVQYTAGFILPGQVGANLPEDISRACMLAVVAAQLGAGRDANIRSEGAQDVGQVSYRDARAADLGLPSEAAGLLERFVLVGL
jgi:hypothetical protein